MSSPAGEAIGAIWNRKALRQWLCPSSSTPDTPTSWGDSGVRARPQAEGPAAQAVHAPAEDVLGVALLDAAGQGARVGGVGARVVLDVAGAAEGGGRADKGVAVYGEGPVSRAGDDGRRRAANAAREQLDIVACGPVSRPLAARTAR